MANAVNNISDIVALSDEELHNLSEEDFRAAQELVREQANLEYGETEYGLREDFTPKGEGFLGLIPMGDGRRMTEISVSQEMDGQEVLMPSIVPTSTPEELDILKSEGPVSEEIYRKAARHAQLRMSKGISPFYQGKEKEAAYIAGFTSEELSNLSDENFASVKSISDRVLEPEDPEYGVLETLSRAIGRGMQRLPIVYGDTWPTIFEALGAGYAGEVGLSEAQKYLQESYQKQLIEEEYSEAKIQSLNPSEFKSFKEVSAPSEAVKFMLQVLGENASSFLISLGSSGGLSFIGRKVFTWQAKKHLKKILEKQTDKTVKEALKTTAGKNLVASMGTAGAYSGAMTGAFLGSYSLNTPEVFKNIYETTGEIAPGAALMAGSVAAAMDSVLPYSVAKLFIKNPALKKAVVAETLRRSGTSPSLLAAIGLGFAKASGIEGGTEGAQEAVSIAAERIVSDNWEALTSEEMDRVIESAVQGAVAGGPIGAISGGVTGRREKKLARKALKDSGHGGTTPVTAQPPLADAAKSAVTDEQIRELERQGLTFEDTTMHRKYVRMPKDGKFSYPQLKKILVNKKDAAHETNKKDAAHLIAVKEIIKEKQKYGKQLGPQGRMDVDFVDDAAQKAFLKAAHNKKIQLSAVDLLNTKLLREAQVEDPTRLTKEDIEKIANIKRNARIPSGLGEEEKEKSLVNGVALHPNTGRSFKDLMVTEGITEEDMRIYSVNPVTQETDIFKTSKGYFKKADVQKVINRKRQQEAVAPEVVAPEVVAPEVVAPEVVAPEVVAPEVVAPEVVAPEVVAPEVVDTPTRRPIETERDPELAPFPETANPFTRTDAEFTSYETDSVLEEQMDEAYLPIRQAYNEYVVAVGRLDAKAEAKAEQKLETLISEGSPIPGNLRNRLRLENGKIPRNLRDYAYNASILLEKAEVPTTREKIINVLEDTFGTDAREQLDIEVLDTPQQSGIEGLSELASGAVTPDNKVYLFAQNIEQGNELAVVLHEVGAHLGMRTVFGPGNYTYYTNKIEEFARRNDGSEANELAKIATKRAEKAPKEIRDEERLAYFIEEAVRRGYDPRVEAKKKTALGTFFKKLLAGVKRALSKVNINLELTPQDIVDVAYGAAQKQIRRPAEKLTNLDRFRNPFMSSLHHHARLAREDPRSVGGKIYNLFKRGGKQVDERFFDWISGLMEIHQLVSFIKKDFIEDPTATLEQKALAQKIIGLLETIDNQGNNEKLNITQTLAEGAYILNWIELVDGQPVEQSRTFKGATEESRAEYRAFKETLENTEGVSNIEVIEDGWFLRQILEEQSKVIQGLDPTTVDTFNKLAPEISRLQVQKELDTKEEYESQLETDREALDIDLKDVKNIEEFSVEYYELLHRIDTLPTLKEEVIDTILEEAMTSEGISSSNIDVVLASFDTQKEQRLETFIEYKNLVDKYPQLDTAYDAVSAKHKEMAETVRTEIAKVVGEENVDAVMKEMGLEFKDLIHYLPLLRHGRHIVEYTKNGERIVERVDSKRQLEKLVEVLKLDPDVTNVDPTVPAKEFSDGSGISGTLNIDTLYDALEKILGKEEFNDRLGKGRGEVDLDTLSPDQRENRARLDLFISTLDVARIRGPLTQAKQRASRRRGVRGYKFDLLEDLAFVGENMASQISAFRVNPTITRAFNQLEKLQDEKGLGRAKVVLEYIEDGEPVSEPFPSKETAEKRRNELIREGRDISGFEISAVANITEPGNTMLRNVIREMLDKSMLGGRTRAEYILNPINSKTSNWFAKNIFRYFLQWNISSPIVNASVLPIQAWGTLSAEYGPATAAKALLKASGEVFNAIIKRKKGKDFFDQAHGGSLFAGVHRDTAEMNKVAEYIDRLGMVKSSFRPDYSELNLDSLIKARKFFGKGGRYGSLVNWADKIGGSLFNLSERGSRSVIALAAYDLEKQKNQARDKEDPGYIDRELDTVYNEFLDTNRALAEEFADWETNPKVKRDFLIYLQTLSSQRNVFRTSTTGFRPSGARLYQNDYGKVLGSLRSYSTVMLMIQYEQGRQLAKAVSRGNKEQFKAVMQEWFYFAVPAYIFGGALAAPWMGAVTVLYNLWNATFGDEEEEETLDEWLARYTHPAFQFGPMSYFTDQALYNRVGFRNMLYHDDAYRMDQIGMPTFLLEQTLGTGMSILRRQFDGWTALMDKDENKYKAITKIMPTGISNIMKAVDPDFGLNKNNDPLMKDIDNLSRFSRLIGFTSTDMNRNFLANQRLYGFNAEANKRKRAVHRKANKERYADIAAGGDGSEDAISEGTREDIEEFNKTKYSIAVNKITSETLKRSFSTFSKRREAGEYALEQYDLAYAAASPAVIDRLVRATQVEGLEGLPAPPEKVKTPRTTKARKTPRTTKARKTPRTTKAKEALPKFSRRRSKPRQSTLSVQELLRDLEMPVRLRRRGLRSLP